MCYKTYITGPILLLKLRLDNGPGPPAGLGPGPLCPCLAAWAASFTILLRPTLRAGRN